MVFLSFLFGFSMPAVLASSGHIGVTAVDTGQSATITAHPSGGVPPYVSYQWYNTTGTPKAVGTNSNVLIVPGVLTGFFTYNVVVTDSVGGTAQSNTATIDVVTAPTIAISPSIPTIDSGQTETYTLTVSNGVGPFNVELFNVTGGSQEGANITIASPGGSGTIAFVTSALGPFTYNGIATDQGTNQTYEFSSASNTILVKSTLAITGNGISANPTTIDHGQSSIITVTWTGGSSPYSIQLFSGSSSDCASDTHAMQTNSGITGTSTTFTVTPGTSMYYCATITDSATSTVTTNTVFVTVNPPITFSGSGITANPTTIDVGQNSIVTVAWSGGTPGYTVTLYSGSTSADCLDYTTSIGTNSVSGTSATFTEAPSSTSYYCARVTDAASFAAYTGTAILNVNAALAAVGINANPTTIDDGQSSAVTVTWSGGSPQYSINLFSGSSPTCSLDTNAAGTQTGINGVSTVFSVSPTSNTFYCATITDSASSSATTGTAEVIVNPALVAGSIAANPASIDSGQSSTITVPFTGGTPGYTVNLFSGATAGACTSYLTSVGTDPVSSSPATFTVTPSSNTVYCAKITDSALDTAATGTATVTVNPPLAIVGNGIAAVPPVIDNGQSTLVTVSYTGGTPGYTINLYSGTSSCSTSGSSIATNSVSGTTATFTESPTSNIIYCAKITDSATPTTSVSTGNAAVTVNPALAIVGNGIAAVPSVIDNGQSSLVTVSYTGGTPGYTINLYSGSSSCTTSGSSIGTNTVTGTTATFTESPTSNTLYCAKITDSATPTTSVSTGNAAVAVNPALAIVGNGITAVPSIIDDGQSTLVTVSYTGGTPGYTINLYSGASSCTASGSSIATNSVSGTTATFTESPASNIIYCAKITDSATPTTSVSTGNAAVTVNPSLTFIGSNGITANPILIDDGQSSAITVSFTGGTPGYTVNLFSGATAGACTTYGTSAGTNSVATSPATFTVTPPSNTVYCAKITDSKSVTVETLTATVTVNPALSLVGSGITAVPSTIDNGQSTLVTVSYSGGTPGYTINLFSGTSSCSTSGSSIATNSVPGTSATFTESPTSNIIYCAKITDSTTPTTSVSTGNAAVTVNPALAIVGNGITAVPSVIDDGQSSLVTVSYTGGTPGYTINLYSGASSCTTSGSSIGTNSVSGKTATFAVSPSSNTLYCAKITDSSTPTTSVSTGNAPVTVNPIPTLTLFPSNEILDSGQYETYTISEGGGVGPFPIELYNITGSRQQGANVTISTPGGSNAVTFQTIYTSSNASSYATLTYNGIGTDQGVSPTIRFASPPNTIIVHTAPNVIITSDPEINVGQSITLIAHPSGGTPTYNFQWYNATNPSNTFAISGATSNSITIFGAATGNYVYYVNITDSLGANAGSNRAEIVVDPALIAPTITPISPRIDSGEPINLTAAETGGSGSYSWQWYTGFASGSNSMIPTNSTSDVLELKGPNSLTGNVGTTGNYFISVNDIGSTGIPIQTADSLTDTATIVGTALSVILSPTSQTVTQGSTASYVANVTGGTGNYVYELINASNGGAVVSAITSNAMAATFNITGGNTGTFIYYVVVKDLGTSPQDTVSSNTASLTVNSPPSGCSGCSCGGCGGGGGGGGGGGAGLPTVLQSGACYTIYNFATPDAETITFPDASFFIRVNYISPTDAGLTIDNTTSYTLMPDNSVLIGSNAGNNYTMELKSISYVGLFDYINVTVCAVAKPASSAPKTNTTVKVGPIVNLTIHNNTINATVSIPTDEVEIIANGTVIATGTGTAIYNGSRLPAGTYSITGRAPAPNVGTTSKIYVKPLLIPLLSFTTECTNSTYDRKSNTCLTVANISTQNNQLTGSLYLNGNYVGGTFTSISNLASAQGNYTYVFNTTGNAYYAANSISYAFEIRQIPASRGGLSPGLIAVIVGVAIAIAAAGAYGVNRATAEAKDEREEGASGP